MNQEHHGPVVRTRPVAIACPRTGHHLAGVNRDEGRARHGTDAAPAGAVKARRSIVATGLAWLAVVASLTFSGPALAQGDMTNAEALRRGWEAWQSMSTLAREQLAPKLVEWTGKAGGTVHLATTTVDNATRYRALCGRNAGAFRTTNLCQAMQFRLGERSALSTVLLALHRRAGTQNATARDAAAILVGLRVTLGLEAARLPATPQHVLGGLYGEFGRCAPPACTPGQERGSGLNSWLSAAARLVERNGSDREVRAARRLQALGWS
ncbi:MAG: hypothetical protein K2X45_10765 [Phreatobacter sp.]|nr:hypothetical protein [Phreatobacter sp.]